MIARIACASMLALILGGCVTTKNDGLGIGGVVVPEAVAAPGPGIALSSEQPSVTSVSRDNWERSEFLVPVHGVGHKPMYTRLYPRTKVTPRQRGEYPTAASAMDLVGASAARQRREVAFMPVRALASAVLIVPKVFIKRPWKTQWSPRQWYDRYSESAAATY